jgi:hypothetical protein
MEKTDQHPILIGSQMMARSVLAILTFACFCIGGVKAQNIPNPSGRCVYNCDAPAPSQARNPAPTLPPGMGQFGAAAGAAIGRSLFQGQERVPDNGRTQSARQSLDQWASEGSGDDSPPNDDRRCILWSRQPNGAYQRSCNDGHRTYCQEWTSTGAVEVRCN